MSYTVLARRYRSGTFDEVIGQDHVAQTLKKAIAAGRIAHAYLFCGTRGTGKTSMARILARALNCRAFDAPTPTPCGKCDSCAAIARGDDLDVIEIDAASNTGVDNVREMIENSQYRPARSRFKVYIVDEAHMLSKAAFNALLKTLEEPPSHVKFILATTEPEKLLPTILSRCQRYDFRNIPTREIAAHLADICRRENVKADEDALLLVARAGAGSMRDSLSLLDRLLSIGEKHLTAEMIEQLLGLPKTQLLFDLAGAIAVGDFKAVLQQANAIIAGGLAVDSLIAALVDHLRNLLILRTCGSDPALVDVAGVALDDLAKQAARFDAGVLSQDIVILEELRRTLRQSQAGRALLDATLVRLAMADQFASIGDLLSQLDGAENSTAPRAKASTAAASPAAQKKNLDAVVESFRPESNAAQSRDPAGSSPTPLSAAPRAAADPSAANPLTLEHVATRWPAGANAADAPTPGSGDPVLAQRFASAQPSAADAVVADPAMAAVTQPADLATDDDDDDLPAVGRVWSGGGESLATLLARDRAAKGQSAVITSASSAAMPPAMQRLEIAGENANGSAADATRLAAVWRSLLAALEGQGPSLHALVSQGKLAGVDGDRLVLRFDEKHETFVKAWERNGKKEIIRDAASKAMGQSVGVKFEIEKSPESDAEGPATRGAAAEGATQAAGPKPVRDGGASSGPASAGTSVGPTSAGIGSPRPPVGPAPRANGPAPRANGQATRPQETATAAIPETPTIKVTNELVDALRKNNPLINAIVQKLGGQVVKVE